MLLNLEFKLLRHHPPQFLQPQFGNAHRVGVTMLDSDGPDASLGVVTQKTEPTYCMISSNLYLGFLSV